MTHLSAAVSNSGFGYSRQVHNNGSMRQNKQHKHQQQQMNKSTESIISEETEDANSTLHIIENQHLPHPRPVRMATSYKDGDAFNGNYRINGHINNRNQVNHNYDQNGNYEQNGYYDDNGNFNGNGNYEYSEENTTSDELTDETEVVTTTTRMENNNVQSRDG